VSSEHLALGIPCMQVRLVQRHARLWQLIEIGERILAGLLLAVLLPLLLGAAILLVISSRRSPLIAHRRLGRAGAPLWVLKLRTMWSSETARHWSLVERVIYEPPAYETKSEVDPRVKSRFAVFCRRYSLDEFPQLWQVVRGEMALIGPRPLTASEIDFHYGSEAPELLSRKPGMTGLWQIRGRSTLTYKQRRRFDLFLHRRWSLRLYARIALSTIPAILTGRNAW
jgi:exopolysaccharide production protein ExoY